MEKDFNDSITAINFIENSFIFKQHKISKVLIIAFLNSIKFYGVEVNEQRISLQDLKISISTNGIQVDTIKVTKQGRIFIGNSSGLIRELQNTPLQFSLFGAPITPLNKLTSQFLVNEKITQKDSTPFFKKLKSEFYHNLRGN